MQFGHVALFYLTSVAKITSMAIGSFVRSTSFSFANSLTKKSSIALSKSSPPRFVSRMQVALHNKFFVINNKWARAQFFNSSKANYTFLLLPLFLETLVQPMVNAMLSKMRSAIVYHNVAIKIVQLTKSRNLANINLKINF